MNIIETYILASPFIETTEGQAIEILALVIAVGILLLLGVMTKYKIFLIFAVGGLIEFIVIWQGYPALVITIIGIIMWALWFATIGGRAE